MNEMYGTYHHTLDAKGRLFIPARLREELGEPFHVTVSTERCLTAYSAERWDSMLSKIRDLPFLAQNKIRPLFSKATKGEPDSQGRILLPKPLRDHVGLTKNVTIVGAGVSVQIWDSEEYAAIEAVETTPENLAKVFEELNF